MSHPKQQHGTHTWDLNLHYYQCPKCGYVLENRDKFESRFDLLHKDITCLRCQYTFRIEKKRKPTFGPLLGHDPEVMD